MKPMPKDVEWVSLQPPPNLVAKRVLLVPVETPFCSGSDLTRASLSTGGRREAERQRGQP